MPFAIITAWLTEKEGEIEQAGYRKQTVYLKQVSSNEKGAEESWLLRKLRPFQFLVSDYWGAGVD